jgi:hypothetical protein
MSRIVIAFTAIAFTANADAQEKSTAKEAPWVGSWTIVTEQLFGGESEPPSSPTKVILTADRLYYRGSDLKFDVDVSLTPHVVTLTDDQFRRSWPKALLEVSDEKLRLCMPLNGGVDATSFTLKPGDLASSCVCKRAPDIATSPLKTPAEVDGELLKSLAEMESLLAKKNYLGFAERFALPQDRIGTPEEFANRCDPELMEKFRVRYAALLRMTPKFNSSKTYATYNLAEWHIPGGDDHSEENFRFVDGKWYFAL